jgi:hypothetical protein
MAADKGRVISVMMHILGLVAPGRGAVALGTALSLGSESKGCTKRPAAAAFHALGRDDIKLALLAQD